MTKRILSVILALALVFATSLTAFAMTPEMPDDEDEEPAAEITISFDAASAGWNDSQWVGFHIREDQGDDLHEYGSISERGTNAGNGIWSYSLMIEEFEDYIVVFYDDRGRMTYNLTLDEDCDNDTAYCKDDTCYQAPTDSNKMVQVVYWRDQDPEVNGPQKMITPLGEVIGTATLWYTDKWTLMDNFIRNDLKYAARTTGKSEQEIIDHVGEQLGFYAEDINDIINFAVKIDADWSIENSSLPLKYDFQNSLYVLYRDDYTKIHPGHAYCLSIPLLSGYPVSRIKGTVTFDTRCFSFDQEVIEKTLCTDPCYDIEFTYDKKTGVFSYTAERDESVSDKAFEDEHLIRDSYDFDGWYYVDRFIEIPLNFALDKGVGYISIYTQEMFDNDGRMIAKDGEELIEVVTVPDEMAEIKEIDYPRGDYDMDGEVTILDATRAQRIIAELNERPDEVFLLEIDADGDEELTILDATRIQRVIAGLCNWDGEAEDIT